MWSVSLNIFGTRGSPVSGSPWPSPAPQQVPPLLGWCWGQPRRGQGAEGSELSIPLGWSQQGRNGDGSATIGTTRATKPGQTGTSPLCWGHKTPPAASLGQETCATTPWAPLPPPHRHCQPARLCSAPRLATPGLCPHPDTRKTKANSPAAEGAIFTAGLNEEVFFDLLKILNII